jgi:hypothetical protein
MLGVLSLPPALYEKIFSHPPVVPVGYVTDELNLIIKNIECMSVLSMSVVAVEKDAPDVTPNEDILDAFPVAFNEFPLKSDQTAPDPG